MAACSRQDDSEMSEYPVTFLKNLTELWKEETYCDVNISVDGHLFRAHRIVLSAGCAYFKAMFESGLREDNTDCINLHGIHQDVFTLLLNFIYTGEVEIKPENCQDLLAAANMYGLNAVIHRCCNFLREHLHRENCLGIYQFADAHACMDLKNNAEQFINNHFLHLSKEEEFMSLPVELLIKLFQSENLCIDDEYQVLQAALNWMLHDACSRRKHIFDILSHIRILIIPEEKINKLLEECTDLSTKVAIQKYIKDFQVDRKLCFKLEMRKKKIKSYMIEPRKCAKKNIYVIGGSKQSDEWRWSDGVSMNYMEKFDTFASSENWSSAPDMHYARCGHGAAVLNGQIYVVGGENDSLISDTVECYDSVTNKWSLCPNLTQPRSGHGVCAINECLYAFGGWVGSTLDSNVEEYDPEKNCWSVIARMPSPRFAMGVVAYQGLAYLVGGMDADEVDLADVCSFNPVTIEWQTLHDLKVRRSYLGLAAVDGFLYVIGGMNRTLGDLKMGEKFNLDTNEWTDIAPLPDKRSATCTAVVNGKLYVIGGQKWMDRFSSYSAPMTLDNMECYDPDKDTWTRKPYMFLDRCKAAAVVL